MNRIFGYFVGLVWLGMAFGAFSNSSAGWEQNWPDIGFWWGVIGTLLSIAGVGALVGTTIHTRATAESEH